MKDHKPPEYNKAKAQMRSGASSRRVIGHQKGARS